MIKFLDELLGKKYREMVFKRFGKQAPVDRAYNKATGEFEIQPCKNTYLVYFVLPFDNDLHAALEVSNASVPYDGIYYLNDDKIKCSEIIPITYKDISEALTTQDSETQALLMRWMSEESRLAYEEERRKALALAIEKIKDFPLAKFDRKTTEADYLHLLYEMKYSEEDQKYCWDCYNHDYTKEDFPGNPDYVSNNRAFYMLNDGTCFVVSKNNYDTFWASQGNGFESCFSLTSDYGCIRGVPFWIAHRGFYCCYKTDGQIAKWSSFPGHKSKLPKMSARAWGYLRPNGSLCLGKTYDKTKDKALFWKDKAIQSRFGNVKPDDFVVDTDLKSIPYKTYLDNMNDDWFVSDSGYGYIGNRREEGVCFKLFYNGTKFNKDIKYYPVAKKVEGIWIERHMLSCGLDDSLIGRTIQKDWDGSRIRVISRQWLPERDQPVLYSIYDQGPYDTNYVISYSMEGITIYRQRQGEENETLIATVQN